MARSGPVEGQAAMVQKVLLYGMPISLFVTGFFFPIGVLLYWLVNNTWTLGQQFFILRKLPPPGSPAAKAKAAAEKPAVDPRTLAPKPGAKPVRPRGGRPATPGVTLTKGNGADGAPPATGTGSTGTASTGTPAPADGVPPTDGVVPPGTQGADGGGATAAGGPAPRGSGGGRGARPANRAPHGRPAGTGGKRKRR
jgi:YidC/Oxa1 family membrane protein insertase